MVKCPHLLDIFVYILQWLHTIQHKRQSHYLHAHHPTLTPGKFQCNKHLLLTIEQYFKEDLLESKPSDLEYLLESKPSDLEYLLESKPSDLEDSLESKPSDLDSKAKSKGLDSKCQI